MRSAIGWIVDVTTLGATIIYGSVSACAWREGRNTGEKKDRLSGLSGMILMIVFGLALLISGIVSSGVMARESYILFALWGVLGFLFFRSVLVRNRMELYGSTGVVWAAMTVLILFTALAWILDVDRSSNADVLRIAAEQTGVSMETTLPDGSLTELGRKLQQISNRETLGTVAVFGLMTLALFLMLGNNRLMRKDSQEKKKELGIVKTIAYIDPLTGVKNKHSYVDAEEKLNLELDGAAPPAFAIAVCDVNGLKHINDTLGHKAGDEYIREASVVICNAFCHSPVFRTGGDEFVVILRDRDYDRREEIIRDFNATIEQNLQEDRVVISLGMATFDPEQDRRVVTVFERADALMYERKTELKGKGARTRD